MERFLLKENGKNVENGDKVSLVKDNGENATQFISVCDARQSVSRERQCVSLLSF